MHFTNQQVDILKQIYVSFFIVISDDFMILKLLHSLYIIIMSSPQTQANLLRNIKKKQQNKQDHVYFCNVCSKLAKFMCGKCNQVAYCKQQHQKVDWGNHKNKCSNEEQKAQKYLSLRAQYRQQLFSRIARKDYLACQQLIQLLKKNELAYLADFPSLENQIQYAASIFVEVRLLVTMKDYNKAHDVLFTYKNEKRDFIKDFTNMPKKLDDKEPGYEKCRNFVLGKLRLISTLANLSHTLTRSSIDILQILFQHIEHFYGSNSFQLGQSYFRMGFFFHSSGQLKRSIASFLKAGLIFGNKGAVCYYNAALLMIQTSQQPASLSLALKYFDLALKIIQRSQESVYSKQFKAFLYENIALCFAKLDYVEQSILYMESALCLFRNDKPKQMSEHGQHDEKILQYLRQVKRQWEIDVQENKNYVQLQFRHDNKPKKFVNLSGEDILRFRNATIEEGQQKKIQQWKDSFDQFKRKLKIDSFGVTIPPVYQKYIKKETSQKEGEYRGGNKKNIKNQRMFANLQIDLPFMWLLSSTQVGYLHQLNQILGDHKQQAVVHESVQNSNFFQSAQQQVRDYFFKLNPKLQRPTQLKRSSFAQGQGSMKPQITPKIVDFFNNLSKN